MSSIAWDEAVIAFKALADQADELAELWNTPQRLAWLGNVETWRASCPRCGISRSMTCSRRPPRSRWAVRFSRCWPFGCGLSPDAARRIGESPIWGRAALIGEPLPPKLEHTAAGQRAGLIGGSRWRSSARSSTG